MVAVDLAIGKFPKPQTFVPQHIHVLLFISQGQPNAELYMLSGIEF